MGQDKEMQFVEIANILKSKVAVKHILKNLDIREVTTLRDTVEEVLKDKETRLAALREQEAQKAAKLKEIEGIAKEAGLNIDDIEGLLKGITKSSKPKKTVPPKYALTDKEGVKHEWSGRGRKPKVFAEYLETGSKEDLLINK